MPDEDAADEDRDEIVRGVLVDLPVRVVAAVTTSVAREAARRHQAGPAGAIALGRGLTAGLLLATLTKDDERVTLQVLGNGPLGGITVDANGDGTARGYVKHPRAGTIAPADPRTARMSLAAAIGGSGVVSVIRDVGLRDNFSGTTEIAQRRDRRGRRTLPDRQRADRERARVRRDGGRRRPRHGSAGILVQALPGEASIEVALSRGLFADGALARVVAAGAAAHGRRSAARRVHGPAGRDPRARPPAGALLLPVLAPARR